MESHNQISAGAGLPTLLTVAFVVLKLVGVIDWSWIWVVAPTWIAIVLGIIIVSIVVIVDAIQDSR